ncbi:hypothetical protein HS088_TW21G00392 [Tripterygium wilfordii]|uniref:Uncharacterized protein n=1 Tax=Tripterygium wilfordii TaxID=458696 RepID=A0A7J7C304_TRIWF|nr:uncharacterized protein LOC119988776 [Tripterygium wilfordii]KAF5728247.1 hypothetical protein HS088_TW21G00392 [Tripterygium wilfordii]
MGVVGTSFMPKTSMIHFQSFKPNQHKNNISSVIRCRAPTPPPIQPGRRRPQINSVLRVTPIATNPREDQRVAIPSSVVIVDVEDDQKNQRALDSTARCWNSTSAH